MPNRKTIVLDHHQISQKVNRIAYQIYENHSDSKTIIVAGIAERGYLLAEMIAKTLESVSPLKVTLLKLKLDKSNPETGDFELSEDLKSCKNKEVILVDDVLNSGRTLIYAVKVFLQAPVKKLSTAILVERSYRRYPVKGDYVGISLSTTMQEHVEVDFGKKGKHTVMLS